MHGCICLFSQIGNIYTYIYEMMYDILVLRTGIVESSRPSDLFFITFALAGSGYFFAPEDSPSFANQVY